MVGITGFGAYIPKLRLLRESVVEANKWLNPGISSLANGERSMSNWDEDPITLAVEAARDCLPINERNTLESIYFASTTHPFADRQNAGIIATALSLSSDISAMDVSGSQRAGTTALISALTSINNNSKNEKLCIAADKRLAKPGSTQELTYGDGAAALKVGSGNNSEIIASLIDFYSITDDFVDHYRSANRKFDYYWEERWIRQEGHTKLISKAINSLLKKTNVPAKEINHLIIPVISRGTPQAIAKTVGINPESITDNLQINCGDTGVAHPLIMLISVLEKAKPGEIILVCGFGQGVDTLLLETSQKVTDYQKNNGVTGALIRRRSETNYIKFLSFNGLIDMERGMRAEQDKQTALTALYRNRKFLLGFNGGKCTKCGTAQIPKTKICVNPNCGSHDSQVDENFSEKKASIMSWTSDRLTYSLDPPAHYGMVQFEGGGRLMTDFTDIEHAEIKVSMPIRMVFRIKEQDEQRGFVRYFWKATPSKE